MQGTVLSVAVVTSAGHGIVDVRQDNAAVLGSAASVLPGLAAQLEVDGATHAVVDDALGVDPGVDDEAGAGLEVVGVAMLEGRVERIEQRGGGSLRGRVVPSRRRRRCRGCRVDGHA